MHRPDWIVPFAAAVVFAGPGLVAQTSLWHPIDDAVISASATYDSARQRLVVLGPMSGVTEWDGTNWLRRASLGTARPTPRRSAGLAYDRARGRVVMFGGIDNPYGFPFRETWSWDGIAWQLVANTFPAPRWSPLMTYDTARNVVLLVGGIDTSIAGVRYNDTWELNGSQWSAREVWPAPNLQLVSSEDSVIGFDEATSTAVIVSKREGWPVDTWVWNGVTWLPSATPTPTAVGSPLGLAHDGRRQLLVLRSSTGFWVRSGGAWVQERAVATPASRPSVAWFDASRGAAVFAGLAGSADEAIRAWDGTTETVVGAAPSPAVPAPNATTASVVRDPLGRTLLFGGNDTGGPGTTWLFDGVRWSSPAVTVAPAARESPGLVLDETRGVVLMYGGQVGGVPASDFWSWNGATWTQIAAVSAPGARVGASLSHDPVLGTTLLGGGSFATDLWEWNGAQWTQVGQLSFTPRAMGFDRARNRHTLFGPLPAFGIEAWAWNGTTAQSLGQLPGLIGRDESLSVAWDRRVNSFAVLLGQGSIYLAYLGTTWGFVGTYASAFGSAQVVFDETRSRLVFHDGFATYEQGAETAVATAFGTGCGTATAITTSARARIGESGFGFETRVAPQAPVLFGLSFAQQTTPLPGGCQVLVGPPIAVSFALADATGLATTPLPLPASMALRGLTVFAQAGTVDAVTGALSLSGGVRATLGD